MKANAEILRKVREKYWTRVEEDGTLVIAKDSDGIPKGKRKLPLDPNTLFVGPFLDAMEHFRVFPSRQDAKSFFFEVGDKGEERFDFTFQRCLNPDEVTEWPYANAEYGPEVALISISGTGRSRGGIEPGDIMNSPEVDNKGDIWDRTPEITGWDVDILIDPRLELHRLVRGDRFVKKFYVPMPGQQANRTRTETFVLRPVAEGSSYVPQARGATTRVRV